ncbi:phage tail sheath subtilisin-like domain-containing protein [Methylococcus sp. EFPC2]|uniref:phage tail sheath subtilisin-like domain-containing protein n=1 Tax=Methylococcus sp. EFPC2 TaxID=2812648 RepID=UPI0019683285|nr:phage tail sheath subtilisin-like domain-containing protein [Methylococcus sp. EFPC2]QSA98390.1 phage tail sheath subtilisin-like domain-containing protein [Methylococcus sp. EFPC2]
MPEYLAPGVYVEETSFRAKSIEGVGTSTTAFVGPTRKGPYRTGVDAQEVPELLTSFGDFVNVYGGYSDLELTDASPDTNYLAHAVLAYFNEGGKRLYVSRAVSAGAAAATVDVTADGTADAESVAFSARFPGTLGNGTIRVIEVVTPASAVGMTAAPAGTLLRTGADGALAHHVKIGTAWHPAATPADAAVDAATLAAATPRFVTLQVIARDADGDETSWEGLGYDSRHPRGVVHVLSATPARRNDHLQNTFAISVGASVSALELRNALFTGAIANTQGNLERRYTLADGTDGAAPTNAEYALALAEIAALEDVSIVAAPGSSAYADAQAIRNSLITHAEARRAYRIAVLDTPPAQTPGQVRTLRGQMDSTRAALYYPWVVVSNPNARAGREDIPREIALPPSGHVCGIYARNDVERGVYKAPANEVVRGALRFEFDVNFGQQELLNPLGVNCLRLLSGRGYRVWGARLISSDPEWRYVSDRRYFNFLEASIDRGTQWAVFEPNGERLWANVRQTISDFLYNEWVGGALLGTTTEQAFFVRCDRSTMTQNDLDSGRLICLIGVALVKPAEFVIFRIGQKTADARS